MGCVWTLSFIGFYFFHTFSISRKKRKNHDQPKISSKSIYNNWNTHIFNFCYFVCVSKLPKSRLKRDQAYITSIPCQITLIMSRVYFFYYFVSSLLLNGCETQTYKHTFLWTIHNCCCHNHRLLVIVRSFQCMCQTHYNLYISRDDRWCMFRWFRSLCQMMLNIEMVYWFEIDRWKWRQQK